MSVADTLAGRGTRHGKIRAVRPGVVRIDITGLTAARRRRRAHEAALAALDAKANEEFWRSYPVSRVCPWLPWATWVTVNDPALGYVVTRGADYVAQLADPPHT